MYLHTSNEAFVSRHASIRAQTTHSDNFYFAPVGEQSIVIGMSVCERVCVPVREHISGTAEKIFPKFGADPLWSSSGGVATLPVYFRFYG